MKKLCGSLYKKQEGFTLVELMIVIIILAILTAIAVPSYMVLRNRARVAAAQSEMKNIATALEMFNADYDKYPVGAAEDMVGSLDGSDTTQNTDGNPYMDPVPADDPWGNAYEYESTDGSTYTLTCSSADTPIVIVNGQLQTETGTS
jgi:general secretion pathway protein G